MAMLVVIVTVCVKLGSKIDGDAVIDFEYEYEDPENTIADPDGEYDLNDVTSFYRRAGRGPKGQGRGK